MSDFQVDIIQKLHDVVDRLRTSEPALNSDELATARLAVIFMVIALRTLDDATLLRLGEQCLLLMQHATGKTEAELVEIARRVEAQRKLAGKP